MNERIILLIISIFSICTLFSYPAISETTPYPLPHGFEGFVKDEYGQLMPDGTNVSARLGDVFFNTTVKNGTYGSLEGNEEFIVYGDENDRGKAIYFYIDGEKIQQTTSFDPFSVNVDDSPCFNLSLISSDLVINNISVNDITSSQAVINWKTNIPSNSTIKYDTNKNLNNSKKNLSLVYTHNIKLENLQPNTLYYYEILSYDILGQKEKDDNSSNYYQFKTLKSTSNGDQPNNGEGNNGVPPPSSSNKPPIADINGPYYGLVNKSITFDGTNSKDTDGYITTYEWYLGDENNISTQNSRITYVYENQGNYTVRLFVIDDQGAKNSTTTYAVISTNDTDNDGWSNNAEKLYETDPNNSSDYPIDTDSDGIPNIVDTDDDNDYLTDEEEKYLGTDSTNESDVLFIKNNYGQFFLIDTDSDMKPDRYYNRTSNLSTNLLSSDKGFLIDANGDGSYEYLYNSTLGDIVPYQQTEKEEIGDNILSNPVLYIILIVFLVILGLIFITYKKRRN